MKSNRTQSDHPPADANYQAELSSHLLSLLLGGPSDFNALVQRAEGAYPLDVALALTRLQQEHTAQFDSEKNVWSARSAGSARKSDAAGLKLTYSDDQQQLPEPHPIDFDWRFTSTALKKTRERLAFDGARNIAVLGAPTLFRYLANSGIQAHLFDNSALMIDSLQAAGYSGLTRCDLLAWDKAVNSYDTVFADPPWYVDYYQGFIHSAARLLLPEGRLYLSVLPRLTRPSATSDRAQIFSYAYAHGFDVVGVDPSFLQYESPEFEKAALRAEGFQAENWRSGDLFTFVLRCRKVSVERPDRGTGPEQWKIFTLGTTNVRVKLGVPSEAKGQFSWSTVSPTGDTHLHSVSRRSPVRSLINVWSSRNVALRVSRPQSLVKMLNQLQQGKSLDLALAIVTKEDTLQSEEQAAMRAAVSILLADAK